MEDGKVVDLLNNLELLQDYSSFKLNALFMIDTIHRVKVIQKGGQNSIQTGEE